MTVTRSKTLRANPTDAERRMWRLLWPLRSSGFHFRKQVTLGPYVADFACHHAKVVIEVDGGQHYHGAGQAADARRDSYIRGRGYHVLRFSNLEVLHEPDGVFVVIAEQLAAQKAPLRTRKSKT